MEIYKKKIKSLKLLFSHLYMNRCESKKLLFLKKGSHKNLEQFFLALLCDTEQEFLNLTVSDTELDTVYRYSFRATVYITVSIQIKI